MRSTKSIVLLLALLVPLLAHGQIGTEFWFAAPNVSQAHYNNSIPLNLHITAIYNTHVTISRPADLSFVPVEFDLNAQQSQLIQLNSILGINEIEVYERDISAGNFKQPNGFLITSTPGEITAYYELAGYLNTDIIALKAANALGTHFWASTQRKYKNHGYSDDFSGFVVVATEDGTTVNVDPNGNNLQFHGSTPFSVTLNKGQTFAVRAAGQAPAQHIFGIEVTSNKKIAITVFDDSMQIDDGGGSWDIFSDQIVPVELVGLEYIVLKGNVEDQVADPKDGEAIFICPTEDNTEIFIDGTSIGTMALAGGYLSYDIKNLATHVRTTKPVYVNHITGYSTGGGTRELGGAILPSIDNCTGSHSVTIKRTPAPGFFYFNNLMVRNDTATGSPDRNQAIYHFTYSIDGGLPIAMNPNHFTYIMDSAFAYYDRVKAGGAAYYNSVSDNQILHVENDLERFHLGAMQGDYSDGCRYGYFSDYAASDALAGVGGLTYQWDYYCSLNPVQLVADGGETYRWYAPFEPGLINLLDNDSIANPYFFPDSVGDYFFNVIITGECNSKDTLETEVLINTAAVNNFMFSADKGCSPFAPTLTNLSDTVVGIVQLWTIYPAIGSAYQIDQDTIPMTFALPLPENHTDTIQVHTIELKVKGVHNSCPTTRSKDIKVLPEVNADFSASPLVDCHPLVTTFSDSSTGHLDSTSFYWNFGDWTQSFEQNPTHSFVNYSLNDSVFDVMLVTESPFGCRDTMIRSVTVHPRVRAVMAVSTGASCSPLSITIDPKNSIGVDTFFWHVHSPDALGTGDIDTSYITSINMPVSIYHYDSSYASPDTIHINLVGMNRMGCTDTFPQQSVVVYPEVIARFSISKDTICDADSIHFTNGSVGYDLFYEWDFNDGTILQDTTDADYWHQFYNRSDKDSSYNVSLYATSGYFCESTLDTVVVVHPYINANFGMDYENNCTPILTTFTNLSIRAHQCDWDFGDDSTSTTLDSVFTHQFWNNSSTNDTTYYVSLIVQNNEGCSDTIMRTLDIFPHVVAAFNQSDSVGCSPLGISFTNNSSGGILSFLWDFGNGTSSTNPNPTSRTYTNYSAYDTTYFTSLTAINPYGCDSTMNDSVTVFAFVDADFNLPRADSCSPFTIRPANLSSIGAHVYEWDFLGSGLTTSTDYEPVMPPFTNTTLAEDTIDIRLIAYSFNDVPHRACADTHTITVVVYPELDVDFNLDNGLASCQPYNSPITRTTNLPAGNLFQWYIDGTFYSADQDPPDLNIPNLESIDVAHTVWLYGESMHGCRDTASQNIMIYSLVDSRFTINRSGICSADTFEIDRRTSRGGITDFIWNFQGTLYNIPDSVFDYSFTNITNAPVNQPIILIVSNSHNCVDSSAGSISVFPEVRAAFTLDDYDVCYPWTTGFINTTENADNYYWDYGDGTGSNDMTPGTHVFQNFDVINDTTFTIWLNTRSQYNCYDSISHDLTVYAKPYAEFTFPPADCPPFNADMTNESIGFDLSYYWLFDNSETSTLEEPSYTFSNEAGFVRNIPILLISTSGRGCSDTSYRELSVYPNVAVNFSMSDTEGCSPLSVDFSGFAPNVNSMIWYIDGQPFSTLEDASYMFSNNTPDTKPYIITFSGQSLYGCQDDTSMTVTVYASPSAEFVSNPLIQDYNTVEDQTTVNFSNQTLFQDNWQYFWDFGDGNTDNTDALTFDHIYGYEFWGTAANNFMIPVYMVAWNNEQEECRDTVVREIYIKPPLPQVAVDEDISGCEPFTVDFTAVTRYVYEDQYLWDFGVDGATSNENEPTYTYNENGTYTVKLTVHGDGGTNYDYRFITVNPKPEIDFTFNDSIVFVRSQNQPDEIISFYNQTRNGENFYWFFEETIEDGNLPVVDIANAQSTEKEPTWYYENTGVYNVVLLATSGEGCADTMVHPIAIHVLGEGMIQFPTGFFVDPSAPRDENVGDPEDPSRNLFRAYGQGVAEFHLEVYNRWGVLVFKSDDINKGWNGFINGEPAKQDVYVWRAKGRFTNGQPYEMHGDVTLIVAPDIGQVH